MFIFILIFSLLISLGKQISFKIGLFFFKLAPHNLVTHILFIFHLSYYNFFLNIFALISFRELNFFHNRSCFYQTSAIQPGDSCFSSPSTLSVPYSHVQCTIDGTITGIEAYLSDNSVNSVKDLSTSFFNVPGYQKGK